MKTVLELAEDLETGRTTSVRLTEEALARIEAPDGEGAQTFVRVYRDSALAAAQASDALRRFGVVPSPLAGVPVSIKDLCDVAGQTTLAGSTVLRNAPPAARDAAVVARLRAAGAVIVGTTNMTEFAMGGLGLNPHYGDPRNPYDRTTGRIPGGSSSGAAVSVTDGMAVAALGTDTAGSVRIPAAFCGLVGFKPTARRVPVDGIFPLSPTLDSVGPLARSVTCCAVVDAVFASDDPTPPPAAPLAGLRFAVPKRVVTENLEPAVERAFAAALGALSASGVLIEEMPFDALAELAEIASVGRISPVEAYELHHTRLADPALRALYDPRVSARIEQGRDVAAYVYAGALRRRGALIRVCARLTGGYDAVVMPTLPMTAPPIAEYTRDEAALRRHNPDIIRNTLVANLLDRCALTVPCHEPGTAPVGFTLMGEAMADRRLLSIGRAVEAVLSRPG